ncbi:Similar to S.cerevisiae protein OST2 (Epsilon subunit of the oligosaccharyltransferase complex) [Malassezia sympodialis ATCC 42132]|uniref:Dolichyl-diphosphooligosaccharide--protein glycosyltransferase subunit OST2 n=1 Tax=Malassezia sympodialis (strain ATCC 42132) TaxID=1230383 RepID=A0A1M8AAX1_MALS4|nr:Similar to S.cerevisiae protein OST2 (Epsilon subunit of the oligosaccharyltransferase complex) [Malassezia sympodialis ATCC 42132]
MTKGKVAARAAPKPASKGATASTKPKSAENELVDAYLRTTPARFKLIDGFLLMLFLTGVLQFVYCVLLSDYPFNSFISGFAATVGQFVLALALRMQLAAVVDGQPRVSEKRAFSEFVLASIVLHFFVVNFLG